MTLSVRDRTPEKKKGNLQPPLVVGISQIGPNPSYFKCIFDHEGRWKRRLRRQVGRPPPHRLCFYFFLGPRNRKMHLKKLGFRRGSDLSTVAFRVFPYTPYLRHEYTRCLVGAQERRPERARGHSSSPGYNGKQSSSLAHACRCSTSSRARYSHASSSQQPVAGEHTKSLKEAQLAASSPFFFAPCLVWVSSGCAHAPGRAGDSIIMLKSDC